MRKHLAVALNNPESIQELFGANDDNLAVFEEVLGIRIYLQGNQVYIDAANGSSRSRLEELLAQLQEHIRLGNAPNPDLIRAVHSSLATGRSESVDILKDTMVVVPNGLGKTFPRSQNQARYLQTIERCDLVFGIGPAGTGKTYLAVALALKAVLGRTRRKLILTRPVVEAGENLGFLPGDLEQKISPYLRPLYDAMESLVPVETIRRMEENRTLEIAPLAYMRGRTLSDCFIILDEAQNTTKEQMKMFLTRIGEGSKAVVTGDITQIDLPRRQNSGLLNVIQVLEKIREIEFVFLGEEDVVRHPLVRKIVRAYQDHEQA
jgi:phosphate starvation-inducible PhoH-like protein